LPLGRVESVHSTGTARASQWLRRMDADTNWGTAVVVDPRWLEGLHRSHEALRRRGAMLAAGAGMLAAGCLGGASVTYWQSTRIAALSAEASTYRRDVRRSQEALDALTRSHETVLDATERAPWLASWAHRFTVTQYLPTSPAYGKFNDGLTSTLTKADPAARIVAVDPKLIPYGSSVWIEGLGWYRAEDCGSAIKGYRLDVMVATEREAMSYGKQDRFVIVVPPEA
jgi:3D (Asp-Asp-Asp) domain-containing protein